MILYPAIDIRGGRCVRLVEGDFNRETAFDADPSDAAARWADSGATWLHVVDLDGSVGGEPVNLDAISRIRDAVDIPIQLGGGIRTEAHIASALDRGISRVILGTAAIRSTALVQSAAMRWGDKIAIGLDARDGKLAASGWLEQTDLDAVAFAQSLEKLGIRTFVFTDIRRDGTLKGPNLDALQEMVRAVRGRVIASGGVSSIDDLDAIQAAGAEGAIIGRALYDGRVNLRTAVRRFS